MTSVPARLQSCEDVGDAVSLSLSLFHRHKLVSLPDFTASRHTPPPYGPSATAASLSDRHPHITCFQLLTYCLLHGGLDSTGTTHSYVTVTRTLHLLTIGLGWQPHHIQSHLPGHYNPLSPTQHGGVGYIITSHPHIRHSYVTLNDVYVGHRSHRQWKNTSSSLKNLLFHYYLLINTFHQKFNTPNL
jgi:hypothetical protein